MSCRSMLPLATFWRHSHSLLSAVMPLVVIASYLGQCVSNLNGYYEHLGGDPDRPIAWGVSTYGRLYNWVFLYNGYHAEHHYRPKVHWTKMKELHEQIKDLPDGTQITLAPTDGSDEPPES